MLDLALKLLLAYSVGSVLGALVLGRLRGTDIREMGSGSAGATNAFRSRGAWFAVGVAIIDVAKGWIAVALLPGLQIPLGDDGHAIATDWLRQACGASAVLGHIWPVWHEFRGGKGAATAAGAALAMVPVVLPAAILVWLIVVAVFGFVGLATIVAAIALSIGVPAFMPAVPMATKIFFLALAPMTIFTHRANIRRMRCGTEPRALRLWLAGRLRA